MKLVCIYRYFTRLNKNNNNKKNWTLKWIGFFFLFLIFFPIVTSVAEWHSSKLVVVPVQLAAWDCSGGVGSWCRSGIIGLSTVSSISICKLKAPRESMNNAVITQREKNVAWTADWELDLECCFKHGQYYDISVPLLDPQVGKSVMGARTFTAVRELLSYNCSPVCRLSARQSTVGLMVTSKKIYATCRASQVCGSQSPSAPRQTTVDLCLHRRHSKTGLAQSLVENS